MVATHHERISMKTALIASETRPKFDKNITNNLLLETANEESVRKETLVIGIRNESGKIYRIIGAPALKNYMNAVEELLDLGLVDELQDAEKSVDGYDSIFSL
jgi:hypothetical protein